MDDELADGGETTGVGERENSERGGETSGVRTVGPFSD